MTLTNYWVLLIWLLVGGFFFSTVFPKKAILVSGKTEYRWSIGAATGLVMPYIFWAAFRAEEVGDTAAYKQMFMNIPYTLEELSGYLSTVNKDKGFTFLGGIVKNVFGNNITIYFLILAIIQGAALIYIYRKYSTNFLVSIFLFITSTDYLSWMFNGIRQFTAVTIIFAATPLLLKEKWVPLIATILLASTIHGSALLMLPILFVVRGEAWNKKTIFFTLISVLALMFADQFTDILDILLSDTQYTNVVTDWKIINDDGTNLIRVLVYSLPTILSAIGLKWIKEERNPVINLCTNMSIVSSAIYLVSAGTSGIYLGRLPIFVSLYNYILLPYLIDRMFTKASARVIKMAMILGYILFFYYQMHYSWTLL